MKIQELFGPTGPLAKAAGSGYEVRSGQVEMAVAVDRTFAGGGTLLVEAPTGTGKSLATGVPAVMHAVEKGRRVLIVTANIALQEQLITKDLPAIRDAIGDRWPFTFAIAKGMGNYLCRVGFDDVAGDVALGGMRPAPEWDELDRWSSTTTTGDLSELSVELPFHLKAKVTTTSDDCLGRKCPKVETCWPKIAQAAYSGANIIVTNYHLLFIDLLIKQTSEIGVGVLPDYDLVVLDEAHRAADIARDFFGWKVTLGALKWVAGALPPDDRLAGDIEREGRAVLGRLKDQRKPRIRDANVLRSGPLREMLGEAAKELQRLAAVEVEEKIKKRLTNAAKKAKEHAQHLEDADALQDGRNHVYFAESGNIAGPPTLGMKPIDVSETMADLLWCNPKIHAVVATSATLTVAGSFSFVGRDTGAEKADRYEELMVESPFDFATRARVVIPTDLPDPKGGFFDERVGEVLVETVQLARGRTLGLFTSYRVLEKAHRALVDAKLPYRVLRQGDAPRTKLIEEFRSDTSSVLLGTASLWEGVDVPGEALSVVLVDRLPFDHAEDPILDAISEYDSKWFPGWMLPRAILAWRQGFGRLIRSQGDRGVVVCCDRRIVDKPYGTRFLKSLPTGVRSGRSMGAIQEILGY